ncbi:MAG: hypothetical protein PHO18_02025 [Synergistaceae bacterium]|nr:hypothetical protein [Synergistaceae bacterium]
MKLLIFLLIGTLIFGFAFPVAIFFTGLIGVVLFALIIAGFLRGSGVRVYTSSSKNCDPFSEGSYTKNGTEVTEVIDSTDDDHEDRSGFAANHSADLDEEEEGEIVELPATALRKED